MGRMKMIDNVIKSKRGIKKFNGNEKYARKKDCRIIELITKSRKMVNVYSLSLLFIYINR